MSGGGFKERAEVVAPEPARPIVPLLSMLLDEVAIAPAQPMREPAQGLGPPDPRALLDWMDDAPAKAPSNVLGFGYRGQEGE